MSKSTKSAKSTKPAKKSSPSSDSFVPDDAVSTGASRYMKFQDGENKIRIISNPIVGWLEWVDRKPVRTHIDDEPEGGDEDNKPKKFMTVAVIDRNDDDKVKILEVTQQSVIKAIRALTANPDWGKPFSYDIVITKTGSDLKTKYVVTPSPKKPLSKDVIRDVQETPCNLDQMFEGADPWNTEDGETEYFFK
jgi:hypothetical protein